MELFRFIGNSKNEIQIRNMNKKLKTQEALTRR
jgi:hypothetical protein